MFRSVHTHEAFDASMGLKPNKATIGIQQICIILSCNHISESLTMIFNNSLSQGIVPDILKILKITPVDKGRDIIDPANFRPISKYLKN